MYAYVSCKFRYIKKSQRAATYHYAAEHKYAIQMQHAVETQNLNTGPAPIPLCVYILIFSTYTDKHNIFLLLNFFIFVLRQVSVALGDDHQVTLPHL
jgi:hypothetical protein